MRRLCVDPAENLNPRHLKLQFSNNVRGPIYTGLPIGDQEGSPLDLHLIDSRTQNIMNSVPEASAKVEIVVLEKDFTSRGGEKSLIHGNPQVSLKNGSVSVSHISFKHTRNALKKRELRLCARVVFPYDIGTRIVEAVTKPFFVKDRRSTVNQAKSKLDLKRYVYRQENLRVVFTDVGELIGVQFYEEGQSFSFQELIQTLKAIAMEMVKKAFQDGRQNFKVLLDDDSFYNGFTSDEAYNSVIDTHQLQPVPNNVANDMPNTSLIVNNYDNISQNNSLSTTSTGALPHQFDPDDSDLIY
ncbi:hypothetical protein KY290_018685 [Solanum tuberosum]|uniref:Uncharacterized protein n=1 Tax=Solanum tuberosum TaxID=4113 RepID=A0ABQ7VEX6_SOLTU|nr:hypothetical protein KY290_018685 [Solanum tuberosum]